MANVSQVGGVPDDVFISRAETAAQLAEDAQAAAEAAQAAAEAALAAINAALAAQVLNDHADVTAPTPTANQVIKYDGVSDWVNGFVASNELSDVVSSGAVANDFLRHDGANFVRVNQSALPFLLLTGGTLTGFLTLNANPVNPLEAATKQYVDNAVASVNNNIYDLASFFDGVPAASDDIYKFVAPRAFYLPQDLTSSRCEASVAATAQTDFDIQRNGVSIGTIRFAAAGTVATFIFAANVNFSIGDNLSIVAPLTPDATLADLQFTIVAELGSI